MAIGRAFLLLCGTVLLTNAWAEEPAVLSDLSIIGSTPTSFDAFRSHVSRKNPDLHWYYAQRLYEIYERESMLEGVDLVVALAQMIHETDFLLFSGSVSASQYNFAGLGATAPGEPGLSFPSLSVGIRAHVQHLKAYGSRGPLNSELVDPRFGYVRRGSATTVLELTGRWATDPDYGPKVMVHVNHLIERPGSLQ